MVIMASMLPWRKAESIDLVTGPMTEAGKFVVYDYDPGKSLRFLADLIRESPSPQWTVDLDSSSEMEEHEEAWFHEVLALGLKHMPLWCTRELTRLRSVNRIDSQRLLRLLH